MTTNQLETWAANIGEHNEHVYVGKNINLAEVKSAVQELFSELNDAQERLWDCQDAIERGCD